MITDLHLVFISDADKKEVWSFYIYKYLFCTKEFHTGEHEK